MSMNIQNSIEDMISAVYSTVIAQERVAEAIANQEVTPVPSEAFVASEGASKAAKEPKTKNPYPFMTKSEVGARLAEDREFRQSCLLTIFNRQTVVEQDSLQTTDKNARGFMSSHSVNGSIIAKKILNGEELSPEDDAKLQGIICKYTKQLANHFREIAVKNDPSLKDHGAVFGV